MNAVEKAGAAVGILVIVFAMGVGWNSLNNRIDRVDEKIGIIQKTLGSTACNAILTRQIEAIEKNRTEAREALESLSDQYGCAPRRAVSPSDYGDTNAVMPMSANAFAEDSEALANQLDAVDVLLNEQD